MAKIGTPENPEILDPQGHGENFNQGPPRTSPRPAIGWRARLNLARQMTVVLIGSVFPALLLNLILFSLAESAWAGSTLAGLGAILLFVPSMILSLIALGAMFIFLPLIVVTLFGRRLSGMNRFGAFDPQRGWQGGPFQVRVFKFGNFDGKPEEGFARDVTQSSPRLRGDDQE